ncbi:uncharacterized protein [Henckelia pumila]|uniref:uncharacterized protein n=1 Tax=Henckelia pumila TaxID=405737 RepID=UPI003C6E9BC0
MEPYIDEIKTFQDARWVSAPEAMWRIFEFDLNEIFPVVINLPLHLPNQQCVTFWKNQNLQIVLNFGYVGKTMLTEYFSTCCANIEARQEKAWNRRKQGKVIGRVNASNPIEGERYYLRLLLLHVRGPTSYDDLLTVGTTLCSTFKESSQVRGLLECDESNFQCLNEAVDFHMPYALRRLFATILVHCQPFDVRRLWDAFCHHLSEDFGRSGLVNELEIMSQTLQSISDFLESMGKNASMYDLPKLTMVSKYLDLLKSREVIEEQSIPIPATDLDAHHHLNHAQTLAYDMIMDCIHRNSGGLFFVNGPGGTGKTYLYRAILATVRSREIIALATATSGVAASILPSGRTAHSRFKIPIELHENSYCTISKQSGLGNLLRLTRLVVWDEAPMCRRYAIEAVDRTLQDLVGNKEPFGGKVVLLSGDFMQVLPVIPKATIEETIDGSLIRSYLFPRMKVILLHENMRAKNDPVFCEFLLRVGAGVEPVDVNGNIKLPTQMVTKVCEGDIEALENKLIEHVYEGLYENYLSSTYMTERAILSTKNTYVDTLNKNIITLFLGDAVEFLSFDEAIDDTHNYYPEEFLNGLTPNGLPPHRLVLKKNCPIMLLRNLDPSDGMCNGTRILCRGFCNNVIHTEISIGQHAGKMVLIPHIPLSAAENEGYPFQFKRKKFSIRLCFAMTINKSQGQTILVVGIYLPDPVFSHGQLYVAFSRGISMKNTRVLIKPDISNGGDYSPTKNVVYKNLLDIVLI